MLQIIDAQKQTIDAHKHSIISLQQAIEALQLPQEGKAQQTSMLATCTTANDSLSKTVPRWPALLRTCKICTLRGSRGQSCSSTHP